MAVKDWTVTASDRGKERLSESTFGDYRPCPVTRICVNMTHDCEQKNVSDKEDLIKS